MTVFLLKLCGSLVFIFWGIGGLFIGTGKRFMGVRLFNLFMGLTLASMIAAMLVFIWGVI